MSSERSTAGSGQHSTFLSLYYFTYLPLPVFMSVLTSVQLFGVGTMILLFFGVVSIARTWPIGIGEFCFMREQKGECEMQERE